MQRDDVGERQRLGERRARHAGARRRARHRGAHHAHAERLADARDRAADRPGAHEHQRLARELDERLAEETEVGRRAQAPAFTAASCPATS